MKKIILFAMISMLGVSATAKEAAPDFTLNIDKHVQQLQIKAEGSKFADFKALEILTGKATPLPLSDDVDNESKNLLLSVYMQDTATLKKWVSELQKARSKVHKHSPFKKLSDNMIESIRDQLAYRQSPYYVPGTVKTSYGILVFGSGQGETAYGYLPNGGGIGMAPMWKGNNGGPVQPDSGGYNPYLYGGYGQSIKNMGSNPASLYENSPRGGYLGGGGYIPPQGWVKEIIGTPAGTK